MEIVGDKMVKVWKDINDLSSSQLPSELEGIRGIMQGKPNFDKRDTSKVVYRKKEFIILSVSNGFIVHNKRKRFEEGHTHCSNFNYAKSIIDLSIRKKMPRKANRWLIQSLIRVSVDNKYIEELESL